LRNVVHFYRSCIAPIVSRQTSGRTTCEGGRRKASRCALLITQCASGLVACMRWYAFSLTRDVSWPSAGRCGLVMRQISARQRSLLASSLESSTRKSSNLFRPKCGWCRPCAPHRLQREGVSLRADSLSSTLYMFWRRYTA
jgi:hypothetical protein